MSEETKAPGNGESGESGSGSDESDARARTARERVSEGVNRGLGVLSALKEAIDETISEARERGDLSVDRAREVMKDAMERARTATSDARERFDFVAQADFDELVRRVEALEAHLGLKREATVDDATDGEEADDGEGPEGEPGAATE